MKQRNQNLKLVIQQSQNSSCINISFLTDPEYPVADCLVSGGEWTDSEVTVSHATLIGDPDILDLLTPRVFRAESNSYEAFEYLLSEEAAVYFKELLDWKLKSPNDTIGNIINQIVEIGRNRHGREFRSRSDPEPDPIIRMGVGRSPPPIH